MTFPRKEIEKLILSEKTLTERGEGSVLEILTIIEDSWNHMAGDMDEQMGGLPEFTKHIAEAEARIVELAE